MKYLVAALLLCACAGVQEKVDSVQGKLDDVQADLTAKVMCRAEALKPYAKYFTKEMAEEVLAGKLDPIETLEAVDFTPADVLKAVEAFKACK